MKDKPKVCCCLARMGICKGCRNAVCNHGKYHDADIEHPMACLINDHLCAIWCANDKDFNKWQNAQ